MLAQPLVCFSFGDRKTSPTEVDDFTCSLLRIFFDTSKHKPAAFFHHSQMRASCHT